MLFFCSFGGSGGFRKDREADRKKVILAVSKSNLMVSSQNQKAKKVNDYKSKDYFNVN